MCCKYLPLGDVSFTLYTEYLDTAVFNFNEVKYSNHLFELIKTMSSNNYPAEQIANALNLELDYVEEVLNS